MEKHVYFVRHGESEENLGRVYIGPKAELTETGREQSRMLARRIQKIAVGALISSTFRRACDTAAVIEKQSGITAEPNELFREWMEPSSSYGRHYDHPEAKGARETILAATDDHDFRHSDEETFTELVARANAALRVLEEHKADRICVVTHGGFLKTLIGVMLFREDFNKGLFRHFMLNMRSTNTGVTYARNIIPERGWQLITWNDQSHLG